MAKLKITPINPPYKYLIEVTTEEGKVYDKFKVTEVHTEYGTLKEIQDGFIKSITAVALGCF